MRLTGLCSPPGGIVVTPLSIVHAEVLASHVGQDNSLALPVVCSGESNSEKIFSGPVFQEAGGEELDYPLETFKFFRV